ncbi:MAG: peptide deformylase [Opitutales bacterium]|nr:peptide deformylase [Opitutales bacterium]
MKVPIVPYGAQILRKKGEAVVDFDDKLQKLADDMIETMHDADGIGLAAQQIGLALQFFVVDVQPGENESQDFKLELDGRPVPAKLVMPMVVANAKIELLDDEEWLCREGCLSFPGIRGEVVRCENIRMHFQDVAGTPHVLEATGMLARCCQHENDHCQGIVFVDRMEARDRLKNAVKLKILKRDTLKKEKLKRKG